jgi:hypothetical protein
MKRWEVRIGVFVILISSLIFLIMMSAGTEAEPPSAGDWIVTTEEHYDNQTIILNGDLIIESSGKLYFDNVTLKMNCVYEGQYTIEVTENGEFYIKKSNITTNNPELENNGEYRWNVYGKMEVCSSDIRSVGNWLEIYSTNNIKITDSSLIDSSLYIEYSNIYVENVVFCHSAFKMEYSSPIIIDTVMDGGGGLLAWDYSYPSVENIIIRNSNGDGVDSAGWARPIIKNSTITNNGANGGVGIDAIHGSVITLINTDVYDNEPYGDYSTDPGSSIIIQNWLNLEVKNQGSNPILDADVTIKDATGAAVYTGQTNSDGKVCWLNLMHQILGNNSGIYTPHNITVSKAGYFTGYDEPYMSQNQGITIILEQPENEPPTVVITYPSNSETMSETVTVQGTAYDADGTIQSVQVRIDAGDWQTATGTTSWSYDWDTTQYSNDYYTISARSFDGQDYSEKESVQVTVNNIDEVAPVVTSGPSVSPTQTTAVITWNTDEPSTSSVEYGLSVSYGQSESNSDYLSSHSLELSALEADTVYHYRIKSRDESDNLFTSNDFTFKTLAEPDSEPPHVTSGPHISQITDISATLYWITDEACTGRIEYGTTDSYGQTEYDDTYKTSHEFTLDGLETSTTYHFRLICTDPSGNTFWSGDHTFSTEAEPDTISPTITSGPATSQVTDTTATIEWQTDEASSSRVSYGKTTSYGNTKSASGLVTSHSVTITGLNPDTSYHFSVYSEDASGNPVSSSDDAFSTLSSSAQMGPKVYITNPDDGDLLAGEVSISGYADDADGIQRMEFYINGILRGQVSSSSGTYYWNTENYDDDDYAITMKAIDNGGMTGTTSIFVTVDNQDIPTVSIDSIGELSGITTITGC